MLDSSNDDIITTIMGYDEIAKQMSLRCVQLNCSQAQQLFPMLQKKW